MNLFYQIFAFFPCLFCHIHTSLINFALLSPNQGSQIQMSIEQADDMRSKVAASSQVPRQRSQNGSLEIWPIHMIGVMHYISKLWKAQIKTPNSSIFWKGKTSGNTGAMLSLSNNSRLEPSITAHLDGTQAPSNLPVTATYFSRIHNVPRFWNLLSFQLSH